MSTSGVLNPMASYGAISADNVSGWLELGDARLSRAWTGVSTGQWLGWAGTCEHLNPTTGGLQKGYRRCRQRQSRFRVHTHHRRTSLARCSTVRSYSKLSFEDDCRKRVGLALVGEATSSWSLREILTCQNEQRMWEEII